MIDFKLTPREGGDPVDVTADTGDIYFWEKTHRGKTINGLMDDKSVVDLYAIAHVAAQRLGVFTSTNVDEFARSYVLDWSSSGDEDDDDGNGATDPT